MNRFPGCYTSFVSLILGFLLVAQFGQPSLALAGVMACDPANFRNFFLGPDNRTTYAITASPMTWQSAHDTAVSAGGHLAIITSQAQNSAIFTNLSSSFIAAPAPDTGKMAWIDLEDPINSGPFCMQGTSCFPAPQRFSWIDGFSGFQNWASGQPDDFCTTSEIALNQNQSCYGEPWAAMGLGGQWYDVGDHGPTPVTLPAVVEWSGTTLDCVKVVTPPTVAIPSTLPISDSGQLWCTDSSHIDLIQCVQSTDGKQMCPLEQSLCNVVCPPGTGTYVHNRNRCEITPTCSSGNYNPVTAKCETSGIPLSCQSSVIRKVWAPAQGPNGNYLSTYDDMRDPAGMCSRIEGFDPSLINTTSATAVSYACLPAATPVCDDNGNCSSSSDYTCDFSNNGNWGTQSCDSSSGNFCNGLGVQSITCDYTATTACKSIQTVTKTWTAPLGPNGNTLSSFDDLRDPNWACGVLRTDGLATQIDPALGTSTSWAAIAYSGFKPGEVGIFDQLHNGAWSTSSSGGGASWAPNGIKSLTCNYAGVCLDPPASGCSSAVTSSVEPICATGSFDGSNNVCWSPLTNPAYSCPTGQSACHQIAGDTTMIAPGIPAQYCSANNCQSDTTGWTSTDDTTSGLNDKTNDGAKAPDGSCLGQVYLFNGTDMRCRVEDLNGATASYAKLIAEIVLSATGAGAALASAMMLSGVAATAVVNAVITIAVNTSIDAATTGVDKASLIQAGISAVASYAGGGGSGATLGDSVADSMASAGLKTGMTSLADPAFSDAIQAIGNTVGQYSPAISQGMLGNFSATKCCYPDTLSGSCTSGEIKEAGERGNGLCHLVGRYCSSRELSVCMVEKETSCCFSSKLARIVQEQGRPQLQGFSHGWGDPRNPNCRGFTPEEFQSLNFATMDLSEYIADVKNQVNQVTPLLQNYMDSIGSTTNSSILTSPNLPKGAN